MNTQVTSHAYGMGDNCALEEHGMREVVKFLESRQGTLAVHSVQDNPVFRTLDVDLIWIRHQGTQVDCPMIEAKICFPYKTKNFFFEIVSNKVKHTPGAVIYSFSKYVIYLFYYRKELYVLPTGNLRAWLLRNWDTLDSRETKTPIGSDHYITIGKMVKEEAVLGIPGVQKYKLEYELHPEAVARLAAGNSSK